MSGACQAAQYTTQSALWYNMQRPGEREERTSASTRRAFSTIVAASAVSNLTLDSLPCDSPPPALVSQCLPCLGRHLRHMPLHSAGREWREGTHSLWSIAGAVFWRLASAASPLIGPARSGFAPMDRRHGAVRAPRGRRAAQGALATCRGGRECTGCVEPRDEAVQCRGAHKRCRRPGGRRRCCCC